MQNSYDYINSYFTGDGTADSEDPIYRAESILRKSRPRLPQGEDLSGCVSRSGYRKAPGIAPRTEGLSARIEMIKKLKKN